MNKEDIIVELKQVKLLLAKEKKDNLFLMNQQREFKVLAEKAGSEMGVWKHKYVRLEEELKRLKNEEY